MHTTNLPGRWFAIHDGDPCPDDIIKLVERDTNGRVSTTVEVPLNVILAFSAEIIRRRKIERLENADYLEILGEHEL
ncbi:MAG: hypothetical protein KJN72_12230 [Woeseia sp.]|nr:hypothetical protein [Woeseia sp.]